MALVQSKLHHCRESEQRERRARQPGDDDDRGHSRQWLYWQRHARRVGLAHGSHRDLQPKSHEHDLYSDPGGQLHCYRWRRNGHRQRDIGNLDRLNLRELSPSLGAATVSLSPTSLSYGNQVIKTTSAAKVVTLTNTSTATLNISSITASTGFAISANTCGSTLAAAKKCTVSVTFTPTALGKVTGTLTVADNASNSPQTVALSGTGVNPATVSPTALSFGGQAIATSSAAKVVTLTNNLSTALTITSITLTGTDPGDYSQTNTCGSSVAAKGKCTISVTFKPTATGARPATLNVSDSASNSPQTVSLTGTGQVQTVISPTSLTFASQTVGTTSVAKVVTLTNNLATALSITSVTFTGTDAADYAQTNTCGSSVAAKAKCTISVTFTPKATGARTATMDVKDSANNSPQTVSITGTGK